MKKIKVLYDFVLFTIAEKLGFYNNVLDKLTGNPFFTAPYISLTEVKAKLDAFEAAILAASATLDGLTSGSLYYFRVAYVTPAGTSEFCQPVSLMVA